MGFWPIVENVLKDSDIVLMILDARMPELSHNIEIERKAERMNKPLILVFNKFDLVLRENISELKKKYPLGFFVSGTKNIGISDLRRHLQILAKKLKIDEPKIGVVGYPNIGKSAVINALARRASTKVADKPGTTRGVQWVNVSNLRILDTPGVIPFEDKSDRLALIGSKHPEQFNNPEKIAMDIIRSFLSQNKKSLEKVYNVTIPDLTSADVVLLEIGKKRGFLSKGGIVDEHKTSVMIIRDWQKGKIKL